MCLVVSHVPTTRSAGAVCKSWKRLKDVNFYQGGKAEWISPSQHTPASYLLTARYKNYSNDEDGCIPWDRYPREGDGLGGVAVHAFDQKPTAHWMTEGGGKFFEAYSLVVLAWEDRVIHVEIGSRALYIPDLDRRSRQKRSSCRAELERLISSREKWESKRAALIKLFPELATII